MTEPIRHYIKGRPDEGEWYCGGCGYGLDSYDGEELFESAEEHIIRNALRNHICTIDVETLARAFVEIQLDFGDAADAPEQARQEVKELVEAYDRLLKVKMK